MEKAFEEIPKARECPVCGVELDKDNKCAECGESYNNMDEETPEN